MSQHTCNESVRSIGVTFQVKIFLKTYEMEVSNEIFTDNQDSKIGKTTATT